MPASRQGRAPRASARVPPARTARAAREVGMGRSVGTRRRYAALLLAPLAGAAASPPAVAPEIDWRASPLDLNLRGLNGERFRFRCPPGKPASGQVVGSGPYTDGSSICAAGAHAGAIRAASGGLVTIEVRPGQTRYVGSLSHYVQSEGYEPFWSGSFLIVAADAPVV